MLRVAPPTFKPVLLQNKFVLSRLNVQILLPKVEILCSSTTFRNLQPDLLQDSFDSWMVQRTTSLLTLFCSSVTKQVARFCRVDSQFFETQWKKVSLFKYTVDCGR